MESDESRDGRRCEMIRVNGKLAITPGVHTRAGLELIGVTGAILAEMPFCETKERADQAYADFELYAEAGTVTNECGKTPRELLDLCREMRKVLEELSSYPTDRGYADGPCLRRCDMDDVKAALAKSEGV